MFVLDRMIYRSAMEIVRGKVGTEVMAAVIEFFRRFYFSCRLVFVLEGISPLRTFHGRCSFFESSIAGNRLRVFRGFFVQFSKVVLGKEIDKGVSVLWNCFNFFL